MENLKSKLQGRILELTNPDKRRIFLRVAPVELLNTVRLLHDEYGFWFVSTISGLDAGDDFEILYHFAGKETVLNLRVSVPKTDPRIDSITPVIPGAILYERELQDMFGVVVDGIPDPRPLLLSDDWPAGQHPLRKDWTFNRPPEVIPGAKS